jgi:predicted MFS family arabinose efflux permease
MHGAAVQDRASNSAGSTFSALRHHNYRLFWLAQGLSVTGQTMEHVALGWLVYQITGSPLSLGLTGLMQVIPRIALTLVGGAVADRVDRRLLLVVAQGIVSALYVALATLVYLELIQVWHVWVLSFILGGLRAFDNPTRQAIVPLLVEKEDIPSAVALGNLAWEVPRLIGPSAAGVLISFVGMSTTFYVASIGFILSMLMYTLIRVRRIEARPRGSFVQDMGAGLRFVRHNELFAAFIGMVFFNSVFGMSYATLMPVFARDILDVGSEGFGVLQTSIGAGAIVGSLTAARQARMGRRGLRALAGGVAFGALIVAFALSSSFPLSLVLIFLMGLTNSYYMITISTTLQVLVPDDYRGRVMGLWSLTFSLVPLGGAIGGWLAESITVPGAVAIGGALVSIMAIAMAALAPRVRRLD